MTVRSIWGSFEASLSPFTSTNTQVPGTPFESVGRSPPLNSFRWQATGSGALKRYPGSLRKPVCNHVH
jgi:hypothetical protein